MGSLKKNIPAVLAVAALLAATSVAALAQGGDATSPRPGGDTPQATTIDSEASDAMSVLRRPRAATDAMPADMAKRIGARADFGMSPELSRRSIASASNAVYVVPGSGYVCVALTAGEDASGTCTETSRLSAGKAGPGTATLPGGAIGIYGIVPDGVDSVAVVTGESGSTTTIPTEGNAYFAAAPQGTPVHSLSYESASGRVEFPIHDPSLGD